MQGFNSADKTKWHTAIYTSPKKEEKGGTWRPYFIHSTVYKGVIEEHLPPAFFTSDRSDEGEIIQNNRVEIIQNGNISEQQRKEIVVYCREQLGKPYEDLGWRHGIWTYVFGLPSPRRSGERVSCHGLVFDAYGEIGVTFPHQLTNTPWFNLARVVGHPLGHPKDHVNLKRLYLCDHHLYRHPEFQPAITIFEDPKTKKIAAVNNPGKYSWNPVLQEAYGFQANKSE